MASNLVIVAIPADSDDVWKVSSEKVPHLTVLFLGDAMSNPNVSKIIEYTKERAREFEPFSLLVDHRGTLGPDEADVLFFTKEIPWKLADFREVLKYNDEIAMAYNAIPQHPNWKPHLTLGYPETPAHPDDWDPMGIQYVTFDKVAVWYGDSEGTEFVLTENPTSKWREDSPDIAEWADKVGDILAHHGVKGMKWGVRNSDKLSGKLSIGETQGHGVPHLELTGMDSMTVKHTKGYTEYQPVGFPANPAVARRHQELITTLDEMRSKYPSVAGMNLEVVPMSRLPLLASDVHGTFAAILAGKKGEARVVYNDILGELTPEQTAFVKQHMPGVGTKNYIGYHEMGHLLAVSHGTFPPAHNAAAKNTARAGAKFDKVNQKKHEAMLKKHGLSFKELSSLGGYAATSPSEALAELGGYYHSPVMRSKLSPDALRKAESLFNELGGVS